MVLELVVEVGNVRTEQEQDEGTTIDMIALFMPRECPAS